MSIKNNLNIFYFLFFYIKKIKKIFLKSTQDPIKNHQIYKELKKLKIIKIKKSKKKIILLICLDYIETYFLFIWIIVCSSLFNKNYTYKILTVKKNIFLNKIITHLKLDFIIFENIFVKKYQLNINLIKKINSLKSFDQFSKFTYDGFDLGLMIISNFCRIHKVAVVNFDSLIQRKIINATLKDFIIKYEIIKKSNTFLGVKKVFLFEKNLIPHLYFFLTSIKKKIELIHWSGSNLDEKKFILRKYNKKNIYLHHSTLSESVWKNVKNIKNRNLILRNKKIFRNRFSGKYKPFSINLIESGNKFDYKLKKINKKLNCIIFSHILHDTLYFFGKEYYASYAHWLLRTVEIACKNDKVNWFIKLHPSNIYRGEFKKGRSIEEDVIRKEIHTIPPHVKFIYPDTKINPLAWMKFADIGITIRGTAGLEMAALNKPVITCGKNRYNNKGFTIDPKNSAEYEKLLINLPKIKKLDKTKELKANIFYNYVFEKKTFNCDFLKTKIKSKRFDWNNIHFELKKNFLNTKSLIKIKKFLLSNKISEYIN